MSSCDDEDDDDEDPSFDSLSCLGFQFYTFRQTNAHIIYQSAKKSTWPDQKQKKFFFSTWFSSMQVHTYITHR